MSLISFHRFLIATAIAFCLGFSLYEARAFRAEGGAGVLVFSLVFGVLAVGLAFYLSRLNRILGYERDR